MTGLTLPRPTSALTGKGRVMRLNQLPIIRLPDTELDRSVIEGKIYYFPIIIFQLANGLYTWRGEGQYLPNSVTFIASAKIVFAGDDDGCSEWPLNIRAIAVDLNDTSHYFGDQTEWERLHFQSHDISWNSNGNGRLCAAQFVRAK